MNNLNKLKFILASSLMAVASVGHAETVTINSNILPNACVFDAADLAQSVAVAKTSVPQLRDGEYMITDFEIKITNCDPSITRVTANAAGTSADSNVPGYGAGAVLANDGTATGVAIGLVGRTSVTGTSDGKLPLGTESAEATLTLDEATQTTQGAIKLGAQVIPIDTATDATEGTVHSVSTITLTAS